MYCRPCTCHRISAPKSRISTPDCFTSRSDFTGSISLNLLITHAFFICIPSFLEFVPSNFPVHKSGISSSCIVFHRLIIPAARVSISSACAHIRKNIYAHFFLISSAPKRSSSSNDKSGVFPRTAKYIEQYIYLKEISHSFFRCF